jgi:hypothetical protein
MVTMIQKYSAYHTLALTVICLFFAITGIGEGTSLTLDSFKTLYSKVLFANLLLYMMIPVFINVLSMLRHMLKNGRWWYILGTFFFAYAITLFYYFKVYRKG